jgi:hypothetical protein
VLSLIRKIFGAGLRSSGVVADTLASGAVNTPRVLILSAEKKNQNYYRDLELAKCTRCLFLSEKFPWDRRGFNVQSVIDEYFQGNAPDWIFLNYNHQYSWQLKDLGALASPLVGFVGDHYDFLDDAPRSRIKQDFFRNLGNLVAMVSAYPHTNIQVATSLGRPDIPFLYLPWAVDGQVFRDLGRRRKFDIACLGALTEGKYPLRRKVRAWIEQESGLNYIRKKRIGGHDGDQFNQALNSTYSAFTCASTYRYTLMKFFEIPASGTLMFAESTPELCALGFQDGVHFVAVNESNFAERIRHFTSNDGRTQGELIRLQGQRFVLENHIWQKRMPTFIDQVNALLRQPQGFFCNDNK